MKTFVAVLAAGAMIFVGWQRTYAENRKVHIQSEPTAASIISATPTPTPDTPTPHRRDTPAPTPTDTPTPTPTPTSASRDFITATSHVPIKIRYGVISLNPGTRFKLISRSATGREYSAKSS
jgi:hypothetical protein